MYENYIFNDSDQDVIYKYLLFFIITYYILLIFILIIYLITRYAITGSIKFHDLNNVL